ncbi:MULTISPECIES: NUDIX hydrolase [Marinobacter]|uniref:NUDIX hydrolase n=1 Tax=Marinobacter TaxID=2742 RepID=UPI000DAE15F5|nr:MULTISPECIES: CoA pyrophosphatase [Marinobacter]
MFKHFKERLDRHTPKLIALDYPEAGVLVPVTNVPDNPELILTQRAAHLKTHRGQVAFPGGKRDLSDRSLEETALRETHEEIGLPPSEVMVAGPLGQVVSRHRILVTPFVGIVPHDATLTASPEEIDAIFKVPVSFFMEDRRLRTDALGFQGHTLYVPCYEWEGYHIWGLSAVVLVDFLNAVYDAGIDLLEAPS